MSPTANWNYPTAIKFGAGRIKELAEVCRNQGILRPLLVTDSGLARAPITTAALDSLLAAGLGAVLFSDLKPNPIEANLLHGLDAYRAGRHDGVVAFGGGSGLDMGKLIAFMSGQSRPVWDFEDIGDWWTRADADGIAADLERVRALETAGVVCVAACDCKGHCLRACRAGVERAALQSTDII